MPSNDDIQTLAHIHRETVDTSRYECVDGKLRKRAVPNERQEARAGHSRTLLAGDFNMNPFEAGLVGAAGLNATMSRAVASEKQRTVQKKTCPYFYNPMWNLFGDEKSPAGTYFYRRSEHVTYFWNMFDQLLLRPSLLDRFAEGGVQILTEIGGVSLLGPKGAPNRKTASDHLPILFGLDLKLEVKQ